MISSITRKTGYEFEVEVHAGSQVPPLELIVSCSLTSAASSPLTSTPVSSILLTKGFSLIVFTLGPCLNGSTVVLCILAQKPLMVYVKCVCLPVVILWYEPSHAETNPTQISQKNIYLMLISCSTGQFMCN